jgi:hypothetical protein
MCKSCKPKPKDLRFHRSPLAIQTARRLSQDTNQIAYITDEIDDSPSNLGRWLVTLSDSVPTWDDHIVVAYQHGRRIID